MPTADRTTLKAAVETLTTNLQTNLVANPTTTTKPFHKVRVGGGGGVEEYPRPFMTLRLIRSRVVSSVDHDRMIEVTMSLRIVTDVSADDSHAAILDKIGALEDYFDGLIDTGVLDGAEGFDDRVWKFEYPKTTSGARVAIASAEQTFIVKVQRQQNRVPAA